MRLRRTVRPLGVIAALLAAFAVREASAGSAHHRSPAVEHPAVTVAR